MKTMTLRWMPVALAAAALLAACGGGGGDDDTPVTIPAGARTVAASAGSDARADNLQALGNWAARAILSVSGDGAAFKIIGAREQPLARRSAASAQARGPVPMHLQVARRLATLAASDGLQRERPQAITSEVIACENAGGNFVITFDDGDSNRKVSANDRIDAVFTNCVLEAGLPATNGNLTMRINAAEVSGDELLALDGTLTMNNLDAGAFGRYSGTVRVWGRTANGTDTSRLSYQGTSVLIGGQTAVFDFDFSSTSTGTATSFNLTGGIGIGGQTYALTAGDNFSAVDVDPPTTGSLRLADAVGDAVRLAARSGGLFDLAFFASGATVPDATLADQRWQDLLTPP
jgi:hypothetical protein